MLSIDREAGKKLAHRLGAFQMFAVDAHRALAAVSSHLPGDLDPDMQAVAWRTADDRTHILALAGERLVHAHGSGPGWESSSTNRDQVVKVEAMQTTEPDAFGGLIKWDVTGWRITLADGMVLEPTAEHGGARADDLSALVRSLLP